MYRRNNVERGITVYTVYPLQIVYTSGTTGYPKAATLSHHSVINNCYFTGIRLKYTHEFRTCTPVPLYHCFGSNISIIMNIMFGCYNILPSPSYSTDKTIEAIHTERCNNLYVTPTMMIDILNHPNFKKFNVSSLKSAIVGGSFVACELIKEIISVLPDMAVAYGATETGPITFLSTKTDPIEKRCSTVGRTMPYTEAKIMDADGKIVHVNNNGELWVRGYMLLLGYWNDVVKTREAVTKSGWYKTGDIACMDEDGYLKITGRIKDLIIRGGTNIYPTEIEQFLHTHSAIEEVQVCGIPDDRLGEEVCAWIKIKQGMKLTETEVIDFCKGQIADYKVPRYILFVQEFPLTGSGKVQKTVMRENSQEIFNISKK